MLDEKGTVAVLNGAYKSGGYHVAFSEGSVLIRAERWAILIEEEYIWPKILGKIVEHIGVLPMRPAAYIAQKDADPGTSCRLDTELSFWKEAKAKAVSATTRVKRTRLVVNGYEIWQAVKGLRIRPVDPSYTRIIDDAGTKQAFVSEEGGELSQQIYFKGFAETAIIIGDFFTGPALTKIEEYPWLGESTDD